MGKRRDGRTKERPQAAYSDESQQEPEESQAKDANGNGSGYNGSGYISESEK